MITDLITSLDFRAEDHYPEIFVLPELRFRQAVLPAFLHDVARAGPRLFDVALVIHRFGQQRVRRYGFVIFVQLGDGQPERQDARIPDLQPIAEQHDLHTAVASVIPVTYRIDDRFLDRLHRQLRARGNAGRAAFVPRSRPVVQSAHHKRRRLIDQFEHIAFVDLIRGERPLHFVAEKLDALHLGRNEIFLRLPAEKQDGGIL